MDYADDAQNTSELFVNMSRISQRASMKRQKMRKHSSNARLMGAAGGSRANLLNRELLEHEITQHDIPEEDFINPDEFEEIAEIYDSLRLLHSR
jgi:hypothetical protein